MHQARSTRASSSKLASLLTNAEVTPEVVAKRERCNVRKISMTISLAFLAPGLVKAGIGGRLLFGLGVARPNDMPAEWLRQYQLLGLAPPPR